MLPENWLWLVAEVRRRKHDPKLSSLIMSFNKELGAIMKLWIKSGELVLSSQVKRSAHELLAAYGWRELRELLGYWD